MTWYYNSRNAKIWQKISESRVVIYFFPSPSSSGILSCAPQVCRTFRFLSPRWSIGNFQLAFLVKEEMYPAMTEASTHTYQHQHNNPKMIQTSWFSVVLALDQDP